MRCTYDPRLYNCPGENGAFEAGKPPWQFWADPSTAASYSIITSGVHEGAKSARLSVSNAGGEYSLYQGISLTGGQPYRLTFAVRSNTGHDFHVWTLKDDGIWETTYGLDQVIDLTTPNWPAPAAWSKKTALY